MIKLNNKNITYVALADSNNSLKAPKEIWYADSSNSVKLVYRRKDALIEGEDYEKYHWLVSNSEDSQTPYIDTLIPPDLNQNISFSFKVIDSDTNGVEPGVYGVLNSSWKSCVIRCFKHTSYNYMILEFNSDNNDFPRKEDMLIKTEFSEGKEYDCSLSINSSTTALGVIDNESKELVANSSVRFVINPQPTHKLFVETNTTSWSFNSVGFKKFSITNLISLVPCKLLKPVPKWLDANGIRRQVGECGMIDLVSGKFYGNVNSVGTFSVENYYERKEWLCGRNGAYIDTNYYPIVGTDVFSVHFHYDGTIRNPDGVEQCIFGCQNGPYGPTIIRAYINGANYLSVNYCSTSGNYFPSTNVNSNNWELTDLKLDGSDYSFIANGVTYTFSNNDVQIETMPNSIWVFKNLQTYNSNCYFHGDIAYFKITDNSSNTKMNLIPCTLTVDLPASMDANNIARTKGTSGMWDLVSDRFYGNVANSGTFKAVNLAEGVDYEVHQWLVGDNVAYIQGVRYNLWNNHLQMNIGKIQDADLKSDLKYFYYSQNNNYFIVDIQRYEGIKYRLRIRYRENAGDGHVGDITPYSSMPNSLIIDFYIENGRGYVERNGETFVENTTFSQGNWTSINPRIYSFKMSYIREVLPDNSYQSNLIPVKLLKSIPSKYDANGIARQAGECGMYDTVNDVFYGNVASSGSFTVSDDN